MQKNNKTKTVYFAVVQKIELPTFFSDDDIHEALSEIAGENDFVFGDSPNILSED